MASISNITNWHAAKHQCMPVPETLRKMVLF